MGIHEQILNEVRSKIGSTYPDAVHGQCVAMITAINRIFNLGFDTYCRGNGGAKNLIDNALPSGWELRRGDPSNDTKAKEIWNSLPNGCICIFTNGGYGHVCVKNNVWGASDDSIQQNWNTNGGGGPVSYGSCGSWCESGGAGFAGAWVNTADVGSSKQNPDAPSNSNNKGIQNSVPQIDNTNILKQSIEAFRKGIEMILAGFDNNVYQLSHLYHTNEILNVEKTYNNTLKIEMNEDYIKDILDTINKSINELSNKGQNTIPSAPQNPNSTPENSDESTDEKKVQIIVKICKKYCPSANAYGIAGLVGNFVGESGLNPKTFEADFTGKAKQQPNAGIKPTVEDLYGDWSYFQNYVYSNYSLNEQAYLIDGLHWLGCGLGQWTGGRTKALYDKFKDNMWTVTNQMEFAFSAEEGQNANILKACLTNSESVREGVDNAYRYWERAHAPESLPKRYAGAEQWYNFIVEELKK